MGMKLYENKDWLYQKYIIEKLSTVEISKILSCDDETIRNWLKKHNIKIRTYSECRIGELNSNYRPLKERFWENVDKNGPNGCWVWVAYCNEDNYGQIKINKRQKYTHRVSWELHYGKIPTGLHVLHKCDNPSCVNPNHLFLGTQKDNIQDMIKKGRENKPKGEKHWKSKLTKKIVLDVRAKYIAGKYTQQQLAKEYNVTQSTVGKIINRKIWKHVKVTIQ